MRFADHSAKAWRHFQACLMVLAAVACAQPLRSMPTPVASTTTPGIGQANVRLPTVWLIIGGQNVTGTLAAGGTPQGHFDPARTLPDIKTAINPQEAPLVVAIESDLLQNVTATVRPWNRDGTIIPLVDGSARHLQIESQRNGNPALTTLEATGNSDDQLLTVNVTFIDGWGFYLWRLNPRP